MSWVISGAPPPSLPPSLPLSPYLSLPLSPLFFLSLPLSLRLTIRTSLPRQSLCHIPPAHPPNEPQAPCHHGAPLGLRCWESTLLFQNWSDGESQDTCGNGRISPLTVLPPHPAFSLSFLVCFHVLLLSDSLKGGICFWRASVLMCSLLVLLLNGGRGWWNWVVGLGGCDDLEPTRALITLKYPPAVCVCVCPFRHDNTCPVCVCVGPFTHEKTCPVNIVCDFANNQQQGLCQ